MMFPILKPFTTLIALVLYISISGLQTVKAAPRPTPIMLFDPELIEIKARQDVHNETSNAAPGSVDFRKQNGLDAQKLNAMFKTIQATDACQDGQMACINSQFAQCTSSKWDLTSCAPGTSCFALPLVNKAGTSLACDVPSDVNARFEAAGVQGGPDGSGLVNGDDDCDDDEGPSTSPEDDGDCDDNVVPSSSNSLPTKSDDSVVFSTVITTFTLPATPTAKNLNVQRRQILTVPSSPLPSQTQPSLSSSTPSSSPLPPSGVPSSSIASPATPTVVVGQNGIVTVTVISVSVSTVTVAACPSSISVPANSPVAGFIPVSSPAAIPSGTLVSSSSFTSDSVSPTQTPGASVPSILGSPSSSISTPPSASPPVISLQAADPTATPPQGISFSTQVVSPTPPPPSPTQNVNISDLLTATISGP